MEVLDLLLKKGADPNALYRDRAGKLHWSTHLALRLKPRVEADHPVAKLIAAGADLNSKAVQTLESILSREEARSFHEDLCKSLEARSVEDDQNIRWLKALLQSKDSKFSPTWQSEPLWQSQLSMGELTTLFRSSIRYDQTEVIQRYLESTKLTTTLRMGTMNEIALHVAAQNCSINALELLLSLGAEVNAVSKHGLTPLHYIVAREEPPSTTSACILKLLDRGASIYSADEKGRTVWHVAAEYNNDVALDVLLLQTKNMASALLLKDQAGFIPVYTAGRKKSKEVFEKLVANTADIPESCPDGFGLVHYGVRFNDLALLKTLQERGCMLEQETAIGGTALHDLPPGPELAVVQFLVDTGLDPESVTHQGLTPLHHLLEHGLPISREVLKVLATQHVINLTTKDGFGVLHFAIGVTRSSKAGIRYDQRMQSVQELVAEGADLDAVDIEGRSCLHTLLEAHHRLISSPAPCLTDLICYFFRNSKQKDLLRTPFSYGEELLLPLLWACMYSVDEIIELCIANDVDVDLTPATSGLSPIAYACACNCDTALFRQLLAKSKYLHEADANGYYLLHIACFQSSSCSRSLLEEICNAGLDIDLVATNKSRETPLMLSARNQKFQHFEFLLQHGAQLHAKDSKGWGALHHAAVNGWSEIFEEPKLVRVDWEHVVEIEGTIWRGCNVLHLAAFLGKARVVRALLEDHSVPSVNCINDNGAQSLFLAAIHGDPETIKTLLLAGADIDADFAGYGGAIFAAAECGKLEAAQILLQHKCSLIPNSHGLSPQFAALENGHRTLAGVLRDAELKERTCRQSEEKLSQGAMLGSIGSRALGLAIKANDIQLCRALLEDGLNLHAEIPETPDRPTPILAALALNKDEIAKFLIEQGAGSSGQNFLHSGPLYGYTAIHLASRREQHQDILRQLLSKQEKALQGLDDFKNAIHPFHVAVACKNQAGLKLLLEHFCGQPSLETHTSISDFIEIQIDKHRAVQSSLLSGEGVYQSQHLTTRDVPTGTALHVAARVNNLPAQKLLLSYGVDINSRDSDLRTPLHIAALCKNTASVDFLLRKGANPHYQNRSMCTAAILAAKTGCARTLKCFHRKNAIISKRSSEGFTIMHHAAYGSPSAFSFLLGLGYNPYDPARDSRTPVGVACQSMHIHPTFPALICNFGLDFSAERSNFPLPDLTDANLPTLKMFLRRMTKTAASRIISAQPSEDSLVCIAVQNAAYSMTEFLVQHGAHLEAEGRRQQGTALIIACEASRLPHVKLLIRSGAKIFGTKQGEPISAVYSARHFPEIVQWLLVGRYVEQKQLSSGQDGVEEYQANTRADIRDNRAPDEAPMHSSSAAVSAVLSLRLPTYFFATTVYRLDGSPELIQLPNGLSWIFFAIPFASLLCQDLAFSHAILLDRRPEPLFPRWLDFVTSGLTLTF
ncbi:ankyrin [Mytilinidion resinicola]|uniref:Ankyrin n=1 Tax=Mytilinidion resinicola TaxID=574789 RepID=A0A6A6YA37_9PEZI|nr:ankyrin [Mytilinidion resinicola]KAF2805570.1 ankyrin [Mytilinidion resinicola]